MDIVNLSDEDEEDEPDNETYLIMRRKIYMKI